MDPTIVAAIIAAGTAIMAAALQVILKGIRRHRSEQHGNVSGVELPPPDNLETKPVPRDAPTTSQEYLVRGNKPEVVVRFTGF